MKETDRTLADIQKKIDSGDVILLTAREVGDLVRRGKTLTLEDIDVVTTATSALMSGTYAVLSFQVARPDTFARAKQVWINSVPAVVGPCPNERIGILDLIVLGTAQSREDPRYGGGHLFRDLVRGQEVRVEVETDEGSIFTASTCLKQIPHAVLHASRNAFKNYLAFVNPGKSAVSTIFHTDMMEGDYREMTFCGCGELNPIENDPYLETIGPGTRVLINGAPGMVTGSGTRSTADKPNLTGTADMHQMKPEFMGGFSTGHGPDIITTWAVAVPVLNRDMLVHILKTDEQIPLKVVDVRNRRPLHGITYQDVWQGSDGAVRFHPGACLTCSPCTVEEICPVGAVTADDRTGVKVDFSRCFHCGRCVSACPGKAFVSDLGRVRLEGVDHEVPITLRQSNRIAAIRAAQDLKTQIGTGRFRLNSPMGKIRFPDSP